MVWCDVVWCGGVVLWCGVLWCVVSCGVAWWEDVAFGGPRPRGWQVRNFWLFWEASAGQTGKWATFRRLAHAQVLGRCMRVIVCATAFPGKPPEDGEWTGR